MIRQNTMASIRNGCCCLVYSNASCNKSILSINNRFPSFAFGKIYRKKPGCSGNTGAAVSVICIPSGNASDRLPMMCLLASAHPTVMLTRQIKCVAHRMSGSTARLHATTVMKTCFIRICCSKKSNKEVYIFNT